MRLSLYPGPRLEDDGLRLPSGLISSAPGRPVLARRCAIADWYNWYGTDRCRSHSSDAWKNCFRTPASYSLACLCRRGWQIGPISLSGLVARCYARTNARLSVAALGDD